MKVLIVSSTRADYGFIKPIFRELKKSPAFIPELMVAGTHLSKKYGNTINEIKADGIPITYTSRNYGDYFKGEVSTGLNYLGTYISTFRALRKSRPDFIILFGDRFEILASASAATLLQVPIAHIAGGDLSLGANDNQIRHSITKLSHLHFSLNDESRFRIIQMGENPDSVLTIGNSSLEDSRNSIQLNRASLESKYNREFSEKILLITFHPVTLSDDYGVKEFSELLAALLNLDDSFTQIFTGTNNDSGSSEIRKLMKQYCRENQNRTMYVESLGSEDYVNFLRIADACVGNSSSGLYLAPSTNTQTINIGLRQLGRTLSPSIINVPGDRSKIEKALKSVKRKPLAELSQSPSQPSPSKMLVEKLTSIENMRELLIKPFFENHSSRTKGKTE
jgi:UDP-hydrolysing UDP-N-acetyl-D-glucosamine 2-epimerase